MKSPAWSFLPVLLSLAHLGGGVEVILPYIGAQEVRNPERGFVARCPLMEGKLSIYSLDRTDGIFTRETGATVPPTLCGARILLANHADGSPITQQELDEVRTKPASAFPAPAPPCAAPSVLCLALLTIARDALCSARFD